VTFIAVSMDEVTTGSPSEHETRPV